MSVFGLEESRVRQLVAGVSASAELEDDEVAGLFARAAWTVICEPGDGTAGALVAELGAADALRFVLKASEQAGTSASSFSSALTDAPSGGNGRGELAAGIERWRVRLRSSDVERALKLAAGIRAALLVPSLDGVHAGPWPSGVDDLGAHAPIALWMRGAPERLSEARAGIALVGARAATGYGEHVAGELSAGLVELGFPIVSGAAYGIDGMAHRAALASRGLTLALLAGGVDRFYPAGHDELLRRITEHGVVLSELPCGAAPTKWRFLQRNRLIAACSAATVVVEAGARSGSLNTAGHASTLGRPLGAVPGPVTSPASAGCHRLLREYDAVCVTNVKEAAELVAPLAVSSGTAAHTSDESRDTADTVRVLDALATRSSRTPPDVAARSGLALGVVLGVLGALEVEGRVREDAAGWRAVPQRR